MGIDLNTNPTASSNPSFCLERASDTQKKGKGGRGERVSRQGEQDEDGWMESRSRREAATNEAKRIECLQGSRIGGARSESIYQVLKWTRTTVQD